MKLVHQAMYYGHEQQAHEGDEHNATEQRINGSKYFRARVSKRIDRAHATQYHRRLEQRVDPVEAGNPVIAGDPDEQNHQQQTQCQASRSDHSSKKDRQRRQFFMSVFEHMQMLVVSC